jgi:hypothetical protein
MVLAPAPKLANSRYAPAVLFALAVVLFCTPPPSALVNVLGYADVDARYERGEVTILAVHRGRFAKPTTLTRWKGRFVASAVKGSKTLSQVEFNFPLVAEAESPVDVEPEEKKVADKLRSGVTSTTTVRVPLPDGADAISIWDAVSRKTVTRSLSEPAPAPPSTKAAPPARVPPAR